MRRRYSYLLIACLVLGAALLSASISLANSVTVRVGSAESAPGSEVAIPITVEGASGIGALHLELIYDAAVLEATTVERGPLLGDNVLLDFNASEPGRLVVGLVSLDTIEGDGTVLMTHFTVKGKKGQSTPLRLENTKAWVGKTHLDILVTSEGGEFTVSPPALPVSLPLILALLAIALLFVLLIFLLRRRRKPQPVVPAQYAPPPEGVSSVPPAQPSAGIRSFCPNCGTPREAGSQFCINCGQRLED
ncbi:MAG: cohesin domain-containing protein [Chloroflexota bacterium]|nr:cohesin domain-containing protein [Chloroflexota bacterium]